MMNLKIKSFLQEENVWPHHDLHDCQKLTSDDNSLSILIYISNHKFSKVFNDVQVKSNVLFMIICV